MKKISLLIVAICILALNIQAGPPQLQKGNLLLGVSSTFAIGGAYDSNLAGFGFAKTSYKSDGTTTDGYNSFVYNLLPAAGYFPIENLVAGLQVIVTGYTDKESGSDYKYGESTLGVGPWVRYYYPLDNIYPFAQAGLLFGSYKSIYNDNDYKEGIMEFGLSLGAAFPLGNNVTFDAIIGYSRTSWCHTGDGVEDGDGKQICSGFGLGVGISVYIIPAQ
jgi:hypothetical protein